MAAHEQIDVAECKHEVLRSKIEIRLKKEQPLSWPTLEQSEQKAAANFSDPTLTSPPSYPSSRSKCAACSLHMDCWLSFYYFPPTPLQTRRRCHAMLYLVLIHHAPDLCARDTAKEEHSSMGGQCLAHERS